jgi:hypothetical protein
MTALPPLVSGLADPPQDHADCAGCEGLAPATPMAPDAVANRPGLSAPAYRPGDHARFLASQLARLSADEHPALRQLGARSGDFTPALLDAWACVCEVLAFYQERLAHEAWLGTARERESIGELGRLIGYRPRPGVAAATDLVFHLDVPPAALPNAPSPTPVAIPIGTRVQSVPGPGETAQTFETVEALEARPEWNVLVPRRQYPLPLANGHSQAWIDGVSAGLKAGDVILVVGSGRAAGNTGSAQWDVRRLTRVTVEAAAGRTHIEWSPALDSVNPGGGDPPGQQLFVFRAQASLFGWNAPHPRLLANETRTRYGFTDATDGSDWTFTLDNAHALVHLDSLQPRFVAGSWVALTTPSDSVAVFQLKGAVDDGRADYALSARVTRLTLDSGTALPAFTGASHRRSSVYGASEPLALAPTPTSWPLWPNLIDLDRRIEGLAPGRRLMVSGRRAQVLAVAEGLSLQPDALGAAAVPIPRGTRLTLMGLPRLDPPHSAQLRWPLRTPGGVVGLASTTLPILGFAFVDADADAESVAEAAELLEVSLADDAHTLLRLASALKQVYDRASTRVHANLAAATHGEGTEEVLGSGDSAKAFQSFRLRQAPLTHTSAATTSGTASSLEVRVNDLLWHEVDSLYGQPAQARVFETRQTDDGATLVQFGDGRQGARPPTGRNNIVAHYRKGLGEAGSLAPRRLSTAIDRPLGLKEVINPLPASGGQDAETLASARETAPIGTLTLGRVVSLRNYEDFARGFGGIAKARADALWDGSSRRIVVSVAGPGGEAVTPETGSVHSHLLTALRTWGDPFVRVSLASYRPAFFRLKARLLLDPDRDGDAVLAAAAQALQSIYGFERRGFGGALAASAIIATLADVPGVRAVDLARLHRTSGSGAAPILHQRLLAEPSALAADGRVLAAEILTLDVAIAPQLEVMT